MILHLSVLCDKGASCTLSLQLIVRDDVEHLVPGITKMPANNTASLRQRRKKTGGVGSGGPSDRHEHPRKKKGAVAGKTSVFKM